MLKPHSFHIPVMGIGFTIDTPLKVAPYGMDSVISLVDDILLEKLRKMYCEKFKITYSEITDKIDDFRAKRITSYLNLIHELADNKLTEIKNNTLDKKNDIRTYFNMLPDSSTLKKEFQKLTATCFNLGEVKNWIKETLTLGSIDVNIMTKVDKENFIKKEQLPTIYNDAHAALRGYANSNLCSSLVLSAGMNPRLYSYLEEFEDFYPDASGFLKKKIVLKVSDYRSALIQGKFLAKKGIWVSEYRIESGLNCGGHAFATDGYLMGPILAQFRDNKESLATEVHAIFSKALASKDKITPASPLPLQITSQGGVGTAEEHNFMLEHYKVDSVGWGSPFLLVPEATTVDKQTMDKLKEAKEKDLYLSDISPLGVRFNNLKGSTKDLEKSKNIDKGRPGSSCPKKFVALNKEFNDKGMCTASRQYQHLKIKELAEENLPKEQHDYKYNKIIEKSCVCVGLGTSALLAYDLDTKVEGTGVSVCPGPNMAYFSKEMNLKDMTDHIYGRANMISRTDRPNMFAKELQLYLDYLNERVDEAKIEFNKKQEKYLNTFSKNLNEGIAYYFSVVNELKTNFENSKKSFLKDLHHSKQELERLVIEIENLSIKA